MIERNSRLGVALIPFPPFLCIVPNLLRTRYTTRFPASTYP